MRNAFADEITSRASTDPSLVLLSADIGNRLFEKFKAACPGRFENCGVAEAGMIGVAAGLALSGFRPVCYTIANFITYRCIEQIRIDLCYHQLPVVLVGTGGGLSYASLGATHHTCEEIGMLRTLPGLTIFSAGDAMETRACLRSALELNGPAYIRIGKKGEALVHDDVPYLKPGMNLPLRKGADICLLASGSMLSGVMDVAHQLAEKDLECEVLSCPSVKPLDTASLIDVFQRHRLVATIEEHSTIGGFGSAVAEWLADNFCPGMARLLRFGTSDSFIHENCDQVGARKLLGLGVEEISRRLLQAKYD